MTRQPGKAFRRSVTNLGRYGHHLGRVTFQGGRLPIPTGIGPTPVRETNRHDKAALYAFDRRFFSAFMDEAEKAGFTEPSALGADLFRDPAYHISTLAPGEFTEAEIHLIDRVTYWTPGIAREAAE